MAKYADEKAIHYDLRHSGWYNNTHALLCESVVSVLGAISAETECNVEKSPRRGVGGVWTRTEEMSGSWANSNCIDEVPGIGVIITVAGRLPRNATTIDGAMVW